MTKGIGSILSQIAEDYLRTGDGRNFVDHCHRELSGWLLPILHRDWDHSFDDPEFILTDCLRRTVIELKDELDRKKTIRSPSGWCRNRTKQRLIDEWRRHKGERGQTESIDDDTAHRGDLVDPRAKIDEFLRGRTLKTLLNLVSPSCQKLLKQMVVDGMKGTEIARAEGRTPQAVSKQYRNCVNNLRRRVEELPSQGREFRELLEK